MDLKERGLLQDTIVIWGGESRPHADGPSGNGRPRPPQPLLQPSGWPAAAIKSGYIHGQTDEIGFNVDADPVHVHDCTRLSSTSSASTTTRLTFRFQGAINRLTDVRGRVVKEILT